MKIVILDGYTANPGDLSWDGVERFGELVIYDRTPREKVLERSKDADILLTNKTVLKREHMEACPNLKYIGLLATGTNVVDLPAARELGIVVSNVPEYSTDAVAQMTFAHILEIACNVGKHNAACKKGKWEESIDFCFWETPLFALTGKVFGIIGYGKIGQASAKIAKAFGMEVIAYTRTPSKVTDSDVEVVTEDELYRRADIVSLHCPLTDTNKGMINAESISKMKDGVIIINTARGPLINEKDLAEALLSGKVYAAGVDAVAVEPIRADNPLLKCDNCFMTPHIAWAPRGTRAKLIEIAAANIEAFINGNPINVVN